MNVFTRTATAVKRQPRLDANGDPVRDRYGNDLFDEAPVTIERCWWEPRTAVANENVDAAQQVTSGMNFYCADPTVDLEAIDAITLDGVTYEIDGEVARYTGTRGVNHAAVALKKVTG